MKKSTALVLMAVAISAIFTVPAAQARSEFGANAARNSDTRDSNSQVSSSSNPNSNDDPSDYEQDDSEIRGRIQPNRSAEASPKSAVVGDRLTFNKALRIDEEANFTARSYQEFCHFFPDEGEKGRFYASKITQGNSKDPRFSYCCSMTVIDNDFAKTRRENTVNGEFVGVKRRVYANEDYTLIRPDTKNVKNRAALDLLLKPNTFQFATDPQFSLTMICYEETSYAPEDNEATKADFREIDQSYLDFVFSPEKGRVVLSKSKARRDSRPRNQGIGGSNSKENNSPAKDQYIKSLKQN